MQLVVYTELYGRVHSKTAHALVVLAGAQLAQERVDQARKSLQEALQVQEKALQGDLEHPEYLSLVNVIFETYRAHRLLSFCPCLLLSVVSLSLIPRLSCFSSFLPSLASQFVPARRAGRV